MIFLRNIIDDEIVFFNSPENISIQTLRFGLNSPSIFEIYSGENVQIPDYNAKTIIVTFAGVGVDRSRYELLFRNKVLICYP